jgi:hypothetical protein
MGAGQLRIPYERLNEVERLIIVAKDLHGISNQDIADALTVYPQVIADRLGITVDEIPKAPVEWNRANLANTVEVNHERAWMKLTLWTFGEEVLTKPEFDIAWSRWVSGYGLGRVAERVGPDPNCRLRRPCRRQISSALCSGEEVSCGPDVQKSILKCVIIQNPNSDKSAMTIAAERRVIEIEASAGRKILEAMDETI